MSKRVIGIDLGTGNSCVSTFEGGHATVIVNSEGQRTTPSVISFKDGSYKVGQAANRQRVVYPKETVFNIKRFMGNDYEHCTQIISKVPYQVDNVNGQPRININDKQYSPEELSSYILSKMKQIAEDYCGETVTDAVITCPAWFDNSAREATKLAGQLAGLNVLRIINEPTAAILASDITQQKSNLKVMVADIGQGTTDFSVCDISDGLVEVLASKGDVFLGGSDWDNAIVAYLVAEFKNDNDIDLSKDSQAMSRLLEAAEKAKIELSSSTSTEINLPYITARDGAPVHLIKSLTRAKMEQLTADLVNRVIKCGQAALDAAKINASELKYILLVGGQSRSLALQQALSNTFNVELNKSVNPDEAVSLGACIQANIIVGNGSNDILLLDVTPLTLGLETLGGVMTPLIEANTTIPCAKSEVFSTAADNQSAVNIVVLQGERPMAKDNKVIGTFMLDGIMPAKRGIPQIEVKFDIDVNGILSVSAKDKATNKEQHIVIKDSSSLSKEEIERIKNEAISHADEDKHTKELLEKVNQCESLIYQIESTLENFKDNTILTDDDKTYFNEKLEVLHKIKDEQKFDNFDTISAEVTKRLQDLAVKAYSAQTMNTDTSSNNTEEDIQQSN